MLGEVVPIGEGTSPIGYHKLPQKCTVEGCGMNLFRVLEVDPSDIGMEYHSKFYLDRCLNCNFFAAPVIHQYDESGNILWSNDDFSGGVECEHEVDFKYPMYSTNASVKWSPFDDSLKYGGAPFFAGGGIEWAQGAPDDDECCPKCRNKMQFILQLPSTALSPRWSPYGYTLPRGELRWTGTSSEGFNMSIDGFATCYLFYCPDCNVALSTSQNT